MRLQLDVKFTWSKHLDLFVCKVGYVFVGTVEKDGSKWYWTDRRFNDEGSLFLPSEYPNLVEYKRTRKQAMKEVEASCLARLVMMGASKPDVTEVKPSDPTCVGAQS